METPQSLWTTSPAPVLGHLHSKKKCLLMADRPSCVSVCARCLLSCRWNEPGSALYIIFPSNLSAFIHIGEIVLWTFSSLRPKQSHLSWCFLTWKTPQHDTPGGAPPVLERARLTSLNLLATPLLKQPTKPLAVFASRAYWWLMFNFMPIRIPRSFSAKLPGSTQCCIGLFLPRCRTSFPWNCMRFLSAHFSGLSRSLQTAASGSGISHSSQFHTIRNLAEVTLCPII